ncbi:hypothetical protein EVAR_99875_1 [Eumeta japonica]|uniref:HTH CENPB-type domain-containing protein n=1 Tax=Eumeta variegata TaxID=151549 RepID=A0A4C1ZDZ7_EUMVA|nr:hypothetical protein EVAR_99875_1 [Eumeta japonica]
MPACWEDRQIAGKDWLDEFRKRNSNLSFRKPVACSLSRATSFNRYNVRMFYDKLEEVVRFPSFGDGTRLACLDETSTTTVQKPKTVLASKGSKQVNKVTSDERDTLVTTCYLVSATGNALSPAMVFHRKNFKPPMLKEVPTGTLDLAQSTGWMNSQLFPEIVKHFVKLSQSVSVLVNVNFFYNGGGAFVKSTTSININQPPEESTTVTQPGPSESKKTEQEIEPEITEYVTKKSLSEIISRLAAEDGLFISAITNSKFIRESITQRGYKMPKNETDIMKIVLDYYEEKKDEIIENFKDFIASGVRFSLSVDEWTSIRNRRYFNLCVHDSKRQKLFPYVVPSQNIPKRSSDKEVPLAQKIKSIARENRADIRHRKIVESNKELGLAIENEETKFEDGFEDNNITDNNSHHVMTSSTQVNLVDYRNYRPREDWSIADILCDKEPLEKCTQINFLPMWEDDRSALKQLSLSDLLSSDMYLFTFRVFIQ